MLSLWEEVVILLWGDIVPRVPPLFYGRRYVRRPPVFLWPFGPGVEVAFASLVGSATASWLMELVQESPRVRGNPEYCIDYLCSLILRSILQ